MKRLNLNNGVLGLLLLSGLASGAGATNIFGVSLTGITTDLTTVGTLVVALSVFYMGYKWVRRMLAGR